jgi:pimeloyl-ACP methyl ester carboxylesterase
MGINQELVTSRDGTKISYLTTGSGIPVIVIPGALTTATDFESFSRELAKHFTVYTIDRRGRGLSGQQGSDYNISKECEDITTLQDKTGAQYIFGHSFGGLVALEAARGNKSLQKIAVYEPGVSIDRSVPMGWANECQEQLAQQKYLDAFITFVRGINPETSGKAPKWLLKIILPVAIKKAERLQKYSLLSGTIREHAEVARLNNTYPNYKEIPAGILLMSGGRPKGTGGERTVARLAQILPQAKVVRFPKFDHFGPEKTPKKVAEEVTAYFLTN